MADDLGNMNEQAAALKKTLDSLQSSLNQMAGTVNKAFEGMTKNAEKSVKSINKLDKSVQSTGGSVSDLTEAQKESSKAGADDSALLAQKNLNDAIVDTIKSKKSLEKKLISMQKTGKLSSTQVAKYTSQLRSQSAVSKSTFGAISKGISRITADMEEAAKANELYFDELSKVPGMFSVVKKKTENLQDITKQFHRMSIASSGFGKNFFKVLGGISKKGASVMGGLTKLISGPAGWITAGIVGIVKMGMAIDEFVKNANKRFATVRGPDIMTEDVKGQFKEFNDQLYSMQRNIEIGMDADQVMGFVESIVSAGTHLGKLNRGFSTYRDAVYVAAKASRTLGMEMPAVASAMGDMVNELRMNMDKIDETFVQVAFDAKKAGLSTDRFWTAIQNATASLGFYGVFLKSASSQLKAFSETGVMGAKETESMVTELNQSFEKMTQTQRASFIALVKNTKGGSKAVNEMFADVDREWSQKAKDIENKIVVMEARQRGGEDVAGELTQLRNEQAAAMQKSVAAQRAQNKNSVAQAPYLPMLADKTSELLTYLVKGNVGSWANLQGENMWIAEKIAEQTGMSTGLIHQMAGMASATDEKMKALLGISSNAAINEGSILKSLQKQEISVADGKQSNALMDQLIKESAKPDPDQKAIKKYSADLVGHLSENLDIDKDQAEKLAQMIAMDGSTNKAFSKNISAILSGNKTFEDVEKTLLSSYKQSGIGDKMFMDATKGMEFEQEDANKQATKTFNEIIKQTLSAKEMAKMAKDEVTWRMASLAQNSAIQKATEGIFGLMRHLWDKNNAYQTESQRLAKSQLDLLGINTANQASQAKAMKDTLDKIGETNIQLKGQQEALNVIKNAQAQNDPQRIAAALKEAQKEKAGAGPGDDTAQLDAKIKVLSNAVLQKKMGLSVDDQKAMGRGDFSGLPKLKAALETAKEDPAQKENAEKMLDTLDKLSTLQGKTLSLEGSIKKEDKKQAAENKKKIAKMVSSLSGDLPSITATTQQTVDNTKKTVDELEQVTTNLNELNKTNSHVEGLMELQISSDPKALKLAASRLKEAAGGDTTKMAEIASGMGQTGLLRALSAADPEEVGISKKDRKMFEKAAIKAVNIDEVARKTSPIEGHQGLRSPMTMTSPGIVKLHPNETILPAGYVKPQMTDFPMPAVGAAGGGATTKSIQISVNATERNLAQRIANEVRGALYQEQMSGGVAG